MSVTAVRLRSTAIFRVDLHSPAGANLHTANC
jgi:hypothetical protein